MFFAPNADSKLIVNLLFLSVHVEAADNYWVHFVVVPVETIFVDWDETIPSGPLDKCKPDVLLTNSFTLDVDSATHFQTQRSILLNVIVWHDLENLWIRYVFQYEESVVESLRFWNIDAYDFTYLGNLVDSLRALILPHFEKVHRLVWYTLRLRWINKWS